MICHKAKAGQSRQFIAAVIVNLGALSYGMVMGWTSPMTPRLQREDSSIGFKRSMTDQEISWLTAVICIGGILGTFLLTFIGEKFGRKTLGMLIGLPFIICWLLTVFASEPIHLILARLLGGMAGAGSLLLVPLYVSEISADNIRGMLGSLLILMLNTGILLADIFGSILSFRIYATFGLLVPLLYIIAFLFLPETPVYLVRNNRLVDATRALAWLRANDEATIEREMERLQARAKELPFSTKNIRCFDLFRDRATVKGLIIVLGLFCGQQFSGIFAMISYTAMIFGISGSSLTPDAAAIMVAFIQLFGSFLSTWLMERTGRRVLLIVSCAGMCVSHYALGTFCLLQSHQYDVSSFTWLPVVALSLYVILYSLGVGPVPYILGSEIFARDIAGSALTVGLFTSWTIAFTFVKIFPDLIALLQIHGCFILLGTLCAFNLIFTILLVPETKGRTLESILDELNGLSCDFKKTKDCVTTIHQPKEEFLQQPQQS